MMNFNWFKKKKDTIPPSDSKELKVFRFLWYRKHENIKIEGLKFNSMPTITEIKAVDLDSAIGLLNEFFMCRLSFSIYKIENELTDFQKEKLAEIQKKFDEIESDFKELFPQ